METRLYSYRLSTDNPADAATYAAIKEKMQARGTKCFRALGKNSESYFYSFATGIDGAPIVLDTDHIFNNQWNTAPIEGRGDKGLRVHDWAEYAAESAGMSRHFRCGHYLEITPEMREVRIATAACGYCGTQYKIPHAHFCGKCIGSEYLDLSTLENGATRIYPIMGKHGWIPLTAEEKVVIIPKWRAAQTYMRTPRVERENDAERKKLAAEFEATVTHAKNKMDSFNWLMDKGINTKNIIYYSHTGIFSIGWRKNITPAERDHWRKVLEGFPGKWDFAEDRP